MKQENVILEPPCKVAAGTYMRRVFAMWLGRHWWWMALLAGCCLSLCALDVKWCVIAFILSLAALMMIMSLVYFHYAFSPLARWSVMEKSVEIGRDGLKLVFEHEKMNDHYVKWEKVRTIQFRPDGIVLHLTGSNINFLMLPPLSPETNAIIKRLYLG